MHILLSNDDGIDAEGLITLARVLGEVHRITVVAPNKNQSGQSHAITVHHDLSINEIKPDWYSCSGTPTDCTHLALNHILKNDMPDRLVSGINHGANLGDDTLYSGTVGAALEARSHGVPAIAISLVGFTPMHFETAARVALQALEKPMPTPLVNINVPDVPLNDLTGWQVCALGSRTTSQPPTAKDNLLRIGMVGDPHHADYMTDFKAIAEHKVAITPLRPDLTAYDVLEAMNGWNS